jgi:actin-related protein
MDLDEMICRSICSIESEELRKRLANQIILVGGPAKSPKMIETLE